MNALKQRVETVTAEFEITTGCDSPCGPPRWELVDLAAERITQYESIWQITAALQRKNAEWTSRDVYAANGLRVSKRLSKMLVADGWPQRVRKA